MAFLRWQIRLAGVIVAVGTTTGYVASQDTAHRTSATIVRQQLGSIAEEVVGKLQLADSAKVTVFVQPSAISGLAENAFVEALQQRGYRAFLKPEADRAGIGLAINVLTEDVHFKEIGSRGYQRTVQTELEARTERGTGEAIAVLGVFRRVLADTVTAKDAEILVPRKGEPGHEEATLFERFLGPLIILAGGIMIVYLFFTVRS